MQTADGKITLVIHTTERAGMLKNILERHGIKVDLEHFTVPGSSLIVAERVKIEPEDLPLALKLLESGDNYEYNYSAEKTTGLGRRLLIPVDFSESSLLAIRVGFAMAQQMELEPVLLHAFVTPLFMPSPDAGDLQLEGFEDASFNISREIGESKDLRKQSALRMSDLKKKIVSMQKEGELANIKFTTTLLEGVAEEVILDYCKTEAPEMVVMATRGISRKEEELIGSVTAEVLDSCRMPVLTVPEHHLFSNVDALRKIVLFCNVDQRDVMSVDAFMRMFSYPECQITLIPVTGQRSAKSKMQKLCNAFSANYPTASFDTYIPSGDFREAIDKFITEQKIDLLVVPNKKTNVFSRIFHPTIAHKCLFERDMPMLALPV